MGGVSGGCSKTPEYQPHPTPRHPPPPFRAMTGQVMWLLVLTEALASHKQEGSVLGPHASFIVCAGVPHCWMPSNQILKRQHHQAPGAKNRPGCRDSDGQRRYCVSTSLDWATGSTFSSSFKCLWVTVCWDARFSWHGPLRTRKPKVRHLRPYRWMVKCPVCRI